MNIEYENLQYSIKRKYSFKYIPEFSESFRTDIKDSQIIPLTIEVFEKLQWPIVYQGNNTVEAKRRGDFHKLTEKIIVTRKNSGLINVHSRSTEGNFVDFGRNSKRTGLFIALFKKLALEHGETGKLRELEIAYEKKNNWTDYVVPTTLPKPRKTKRPDLTVSIISALIIGISFGILIGFLKVNFTYYVGVYELCIGFGVGYLFSQVLKATNYIDFPPIKIMVGGIMVVMFITSLFTQYHLLISENNISEFNFIEFIILRIENGLTIDALKTGWIGLLLSWIFMMVFPYFLAISLVAVSLAKSVINRIPEKVLEYAVYLFEKGNSESAVRAELALKGWNKKNDQDNVFQALAEISGFQQANRE